MKKLIVLIFCCATFTAFAQKEVKVDDAKNHAGEQVKICTKIYSGKSIANSRDTLIFLDAGAAYPASPLRVVIKGSPLKEFKGDILKYYKDKAVCISGTIEMYKGKPEIQITDKSQIIEQMGDIETSAEPK
ncbi:MAG: hypothetical protein ABI683_07570 [Ginsengibacter sp.]